MSAREGADVDYDMDGQADLYPAEGTLKPPFAILGGHSAAHPGQGDSSVSCGLQLKGGGERRVGGIVRLLLARGT